MNKYRIVQIEKGFIVQKKFLGLFWICCSEPYMEKYYYSYTYFHNYTSKSYIYDTEQLARNAISRLKHKISYYKGHKISYFIDKNGDKGFVDLKSAYKDGHNISYYNISSSIEEVRRKIDEIKKEKKEKNKIIKVINID